MSANEQRKPVSHNRLKAGFIAGFIAKDATNVVVQMLREHSGIELSPELRNDVFFAIVHAISAAASDEQKKEAA